MDVRHLSLWLLVWSALHFVLHARIPSPFISNLLAVVFVVFMHSTNDLDPQRFLYAVLVHLLSVVLTLPPRLTVTDAVVNAVTLATYCACVYILGDNVYDIYSRYRDYLHKRCDDDGGGREN
jgi:hypothetical protein